MTVYVEYVILDNLIINSMLLWFVFRTLKEKPIKSKIALAACVGTAFSLVSPLIEASGVFALLIKLFAGAFMVFIIQSKNFTRWFTSYLLFLTFTFMFGGMLFGVLSMLNTTPASLVNFTYLTNVPVGVMVLALLVWAKVTLMLVNYINVRRSLSGFLRDIIITYNGKQFRLTSFVDSGNRLCDPETNAPVVIISLNFFLKMFPDVAIDKVLLNKLCGIEGGKYINYNTVQSTGAKMFVFRPEKIEVLGDRQTLETKDVALGVTLKSFKDAVKYQALLNPALIA